jgi:hypothetical protein
MILKSTDEPLLDVRLPMPPSDNNLVRLARLGAYPTTDYREWLRVCAPILDDALADFRGAGAAWADHDLLLGIGRTPWYSVHTTMVMPSGRRDSANYEKALFDLLSGKRLECPHKRSSRLITSDGVWPDDSLIAEHTTQVAAKGGEDHGVNATVYLAAPPTNLDTQAKLRPKCERRLAKIVKGEKPPCLQCHRPVPCGPRCPFWIIPGPGAVTAVLCTACVRALLLARHTSPAAQNLVQSRADLHWEFIHQALGERLIAATHDLVWD